VVSVGACAEKRAGHVSNVAGVERHGVERHGVEGTLEKYPTWMANRPAHNRVCSRRRPRKHRHAEGQTKKQSFLASYVSYGFHFRRHHRIWRRVAHCRNGRSLQRTTENAERSSHIGGEEVNDSPTACASSGFMPIDFFCPCLWGKGKWPDLIRIIREKVSQNAIKRERDALRKLLVAMR